MKRIGMCCLCGCYASKDETVFVQGMEACRECAYLAGGDDGDDFDNDDDSPTGDAATADERTNR